MTKPSRGFLIGLITPALALTAAILVGWGQERHWLPRYEATDCSAYQRGVPHCLYWHENARR